MPWVNAILLAAAMNVTDSTAPQGGEVELVCHTVYFTLKEPTRANIDQFVASCRKHSSKHEGAIFFACGERAEGPAGPFKDKDFHVSQTIIFRGRESVEAYMKSDARQRFVDECKPLWSKVRVFESNLRGMEMPAVKSAEPNRK